MTKLPVIVIGIDGGTMDLIVPWVKKNYLPNLKKLMQSGSWGISETTIPPLTGPAWSSFQTGMNPGKHGNFDWLIRMKGSYHLEPITSNSIKNNSLWHIVSRQNKKVGVINVPVTYPPYPVNGFLISGVLTPQGENYTYPAGLKDEIEKEIGEYNILPKYRYNKYHLDKWRKSLKETIDIRKKTSVYLLKKYHPDLFMVHFITTDLVQHMQWSDSLSEDNIILDIYQEVDKAIGEIINVFPSEKFNLFILSDHGFGKLDFNIYMNIWLLKEGYLKIKKSIKSKIKKLLYNAGFTIANIWKFMDKIGFLRFGLNTSKGTRYNVMRLLFLSVDDIDWDNTIAYSHGNMGQIYINVKGREPRGIVPEEKKESVINEIITKLKILKHPMKNEKLFSRIYKKQDIYHGEKIFDAPDILLITKDPSILTVGAGEFVSNKFFEPSFAFNGYHRMDGVFIANGPAIKKNQNIKVKITDLAPTILYNMGLSIPENMDGKVIRDIFEDSFIKKHKLHYYKSEKNKKQDKDNKSNKDARVIMERLKNLGYV